MRKLYSYDSVAIVTSEHAPLRSMAQRMRADSVAYMGSKDNHRIRGGTRHRAEILLRILYAARALILGGFV